MKGRMNIFLFRPLHDMTQIQTRPAGKPVYGLGFIYKLFLAGDQNDD